MSIEETAAPTVERRQSGKLYGRTATEIAGPLGDRGEVVRYRRVLTGRQHRLMLGLAGLHMALALLLVVYLPLPG